MIEELYIEDYLKSIKEEFKLNIKNNKYLNMYYSKIELLIDNNSFINDMLIIDVYKSAKNRVSRKLLLEVANTLMIHYKKGAIVINDIFLYNRSGNNENPKIINISKLIEDDTLKKMVSNAIKLANKLYTNNEEGYTLINNIDTNISFELGKNGIGKTFSKNVPIEKIPTAMKLKKLCEEAIYFKTSYNKDDNNGIKYHHFLTPVMAYRTDGNSFVRIVVKEYTKRKDLNNKFYYHQIEYINEKEMFLPAALQSNENQAFESISLEFNNTTNDY